MKKLLMMAAVAGMVFASCSSENDDYIAQNSNKDVQLSFAAPVMYKATRANGIGEVSGTTYPSDQSFMVYGWKYTGEYKGWATTSAVWTSEFEDAGMNEKNATTGTEVKPVGDPVIGWFPAKKHLFDNDINTNYLFTGYSPAELTTSGATISYGQTGLNVTGYIVPAIDAQMDIMYANRAYDINKSTNLNQSVTNTPEGTTYSGVNLKFKHALSSVHFKTCVDPEFMKVYEELGYGTLPVFKIKNIKVDLVANQGDFTEGVTESKVFEYSDNPKWTKVSGSEQYEFFNSAEGALVPVPQEGQTLQDALVDITNPGSFNGGKSGILMPQKFDAQSSAKITITWSHDDVVETSTILLKDSKTTEWLPGKKYIYNIIFKENLIYFAPEVVDWTEDPVGGENITPVPDPLP